MKKLKRGSQCAEAAGGKGEGVAPTFLSVLSIGDHLGILELLLPQSGWRDFREGSRASERHGQFQFRLKNL